MHKLLIVDDEDHIRKLYRDYLTREGYEVVTAASADEAMKVVAEAAPDLVVLDIELVETTGLEVLKTLKEKYPALPVILNSAYSTYKSDFHTWVADAYIVKSSNMVPLKEKINELVKI
ncbi:Response regulator receiver protein [Candidatus Zixiibacteriota bacterium]|nr:Response regulator receiver protein [candidate division Zixibacteria bacterium]